jgi:hypothetical protein
MKALTIFRILTFVLLPIAALFGVLDFFMLFAALANPAMLFIVFVMAGFVIYSFSSLRFLTKGIDLNKPCKPSLKDWIKVNGYVSVFMGVSFLMNALTIFFSSEANLKQILNTFLETQSNVPPMLTPEIFIYAMKIAAYFLFFVSVVLLAHIPVTFRLLKQYGYLFEEPTAAE